MLEGIDALSALERFSTVSEAAVRLRLTQSAVSKRIQALRAALGFAIVEPQGRKLRLTPRAMVFLEQARPLVAELRALSSPSGDDSQAAFSLGMADSIAASWGPRVLARALGRVGDVRLELHAHRSVLLVESVRLGRYHMALSTDVPSATDLIHSPIVDEPLVLVNSRLRPTFPKGAPSIVIEPGSATWRAIEPLLREREGGILAGPLLEVESFGAALQMARAGFGNALVPLGLALEMGVREGAYRELDVRRRICLLTRKTVYQARVFQRLMAALVEEARSSFAKGRARTRPAGGGGRRQRLPG